MQETDLFARFAGQDHKHGQPVLDPVQAAHPGHGSALWSDHELVPGASSAVFSGQVLPFKITGRGDDAAVPSPCLCEGGL